MEPELGQLGPVSPQLVFMLFLIGYCFLGTDGITFFLLLGVEPVFKSTVDACNRFEIFPLQTGQLDLDVKTFLQYGDQLDHSQ